MKYLLVALVVIHGLLHLVGVVKAFGLAPLPQLSLAIPRPIGLLWLAAALLCLLTAGWLLSARPGWYWAALAAALLSQSVIALCWQDARFGSLANLVLLIAAGLGLAQADFSARAAADASRLLSAAGHDSKRLSEADLSHLPQPVQTWLRRSGCLGKPLITSLRLHQRGEMRTSPAGAWMPVRAEQTFATQPPGFSWFARVEALPGIDLLGHDRYHEGQGAMLIKALGLIPVAAAQGPAIDQGAMLRYLAETVWFPSAALSPSIAWEALDAHSARATISAGGQSASARFSFSQEGDPLRIEARRYYDRKTGATLEDWRIDIEPDSFQDFDGLRVPARSRVSWRLAEGDFTWFRLRITDIDYSPAAKPAP